MKAFNDNKIQSYITLPALLILASFSYSNVIADSDVSSEEGYVASLVKSLDDQATAPEITEDQYVESIINSIENPVTYTEDDYVQSLVESSGGTASIQGNNHRVKSLSSETFLTSQNVGDIYVPEKNNIRVKPLTSFQFLSPYAEDRRADNLHNSATINEVKTRGGLAHSTSVSN